MSDEIHYYFVLARRVIYQPTPSMPRVVHSFKSCALLARYRVPKGRYHNAQRLNRIPTDVYEFLYFPNIISLPIEEET